MAASMRVARHLQRLHWRVSAVPIVGKLYTRGYGSLQILKGQLSFLAWKFFGMGPILDRRAVKGFYAQSVERTYSAGSTDQIEGRLVVRIAFHLVNARLKYLAEMLEQLRELPFSKVFIAIDTNSRKTESLLRAAGVDFVDEFTVHEDLEDPFKLTWRHRDQLKRVVNEFDYFMYAEDDLLITPEAVRLWHARLPILKPLGYLPGFLRVEFNREKELVSSDFTHSAGSDLVHLIDGQPYLKTPFPYQAFWLYDKETMLAFIDSDIYATGQPDFDKREAMAAGYTYEKTADGFRSRHLLPMIRQDRIDPRCFVFHMPSNYGRLRVPNPAHLGTIPIDDLVQSVRHERPST